eukprot:CAMPEP_0204900682 /NCGR_PEP_ID=MMETSP1397-20131031/2621_1 /ASSEMBLY_ACC=CAM_ASM_000891 /TAXON_ID=49980 /ORGANISM="Climacostomum Climacostomum virens, Strain Stock W-24" /LENGTH=237 /DNA_ID=CAMNT_0052068881 /DNA_START=88 /DNA_END=802 /DNA_ORIENTATION=-
MVEYIPTSAGLLLAGKRVIKDPASPDIFVVCHGFNSSMDLDFNHAISDDLPYNSFRFDFSGNGLSPGSTTMADYPKEVEELRFVVLYLKTQGFVVKGLIGHSKSATTVLIYNVKYGDIPLTVSISGQYYTQDDPIFIQVKLKELYQNGYIDLRLGGKPYRITLEAYEERLRLDIDALCKACKRDVIVIHGSSDEFTHVKDAYELIHALGPRHAGSHKFKTETTYLPIQGLNSCKLSG